VGPLPWAWTGWAGGALPQSTLLGGLVVVPDEVAAVARVYLWWPFATALQLVRSTLSGGLYPVRGAYPVTVTQSTRTNYCLNPSARSGLNGYVQGTGAPTLSQVSRTDVADTAWRATIASAGTDEVTIPQSLPGGQAATIGIDVAFSARPTGCTITVGWVNSAGVALTSSVITLTADQINMSVGQYARQTGVVTAPSGAAACSTVKLAAAGLPAGGWMSGSRCTMEQGTTDGAVLDGDALGGQWLGAPELSAAILAPVIEIDDGECPLDQLVSYTLYQPSLVGGGSAASPPITLPSNGLAWFTHPSDPGNPMQVSPTVTPTEVYALARGSFAIIGRARPVVVSSSVRQAATGTITLDCPTFDARDALLDLLSDGQPVLLRTDAAFGYPDDMWLSLGDITADPGGRMAWQQTRILSAAYAVVDSPDAAIV
jgi:hypothetical protein